MVVLISGSFKIFIIVLNEFLKIKSKDMYEYLCIFLCNF